mmetsp:Transcript_52832/g.115931  ORF Transcript_52832/g.115931 Transcript_52832/m.115931 type:complete len:259 (+) Transcript_52832:2287-3063(+)
MTRPRLSYEIAFSIPLLKPWSSWGCSSLLARSSAQRCGRIMLRLHPHSRIRALLERLDSRQLRATGMQAKERAPALWDRGRPQVLLDPEDQGPLLDGASAALLRGPEWAHQEWGGRPRRWDRLVWGARHLWVAHLVRASVARLALAWAAVWVCRLARGWAVRRWAACLLVLEWVPRLAPLLAVQLVWEWGGHRVPAWEAPHREWWGRLGCPVLGGLECLDQRGPQLRGRMVLTVTAEIRAMVEVRVVMGHRAMPVGSR